MQELELLLHFETFAKQLRIFSCLGINYFSLADEGVNYLFMLEVAA